MPLAAVVEKGRAKLTGTAVTGALYSLICTHPSGRVRPVRGATLASLSGGAYLVYDYELPLGLPVTYQALVYDASDTSTPIDTSDPVTVTWTSAYQWLKDPLEPIRNMAITIRDPGEEAFTTPTGVFPILGRPDAVTVADVRTAASGTVTFITYTQEERDRLHYITSSGHVLLLQGTQEEGIGNLYLAPLGIKASRVIPQSRTEQRRFWDVDYQEVAPPVGDSAPVVTWQDLVDQYDTWQAVLDAGWSTWLELNEGLNSGRPAPIITWRGA